MRIVVENLRSLLVTDDIKLKSLLVRKYSVRQKGYQFTPAYRTRGWDGFIKFFQESGTFGTGLLEDIIADLQKVGADFEIEDKRNKEDIIIKPYSGPITLRDYQNSLMFKAFNKGRCIIKAPTGAGKGIILAAMAQKLEDNFGVVVFNKKSLVIQSFEKFQEMGIDCGICYGEGEIWKPVMLTTIQSIDKLYDQYADLAKFVMFDEVHEMCSGKFSKKVINAFPNAYYRWGFTATPPKDPEKLNNLKSAFGPIIQEISAKEMVDEGRLAKPIIFMISADQSDEDENGGEILEYDDYQEEYQKFIVDCDSRNKKIADLTNTLVSNNRKVLIVVKSLDHAAKLEKLIPNAVKLEGKDEMAIRKREIEIFRKAKEGVCVIGTVIFQTGVDVPEITDVINARGLKSEIATLQLLGRGMRLAEGKTKFHYYDFYDNGKYLSKHSNERAKAYIREGHRLEKLK